MNNERLTVWKIVRDIQNELLENVNRKAYEDMSEYEEGRDTLVYEAIDNACIYYADCFNLLWDMQITDFEEAIACGHKDLTGIVAYHLNDAIWEELDTKESEDILTELLERELPSVAEVGGYNIIYKLNGSCYCPECASKNIHIEEEDGFVHWEGDSLECEECGETLHSEYGNPEEDNDNE